MKKNQQGFSIIELVLIVVAVGLIGGVGWWAYQHNRPDIGNAARDTEQPADNKPVTTPPGPTVTYLEVKEWGVKLPLPDSVKDAYYVIGGFGDSPDRLPGGVFLGLKSLTDTKCDPNNNNRGGRGAIGAILRFLPTERDMVTGQLLTEEYPNGRIVGDYYYAYQSGTKDNPCASEAALQTMDTAFANAAKITTSTGAMN